MKLSHSFKWRLRSGAFLTPLIRALFGWRYRNFSNAAAHSAVPLDQIKSVLLLRLDEIGDVVLTTPLLRELRRNLPRAWITLVVEPGVRNLVELCPHVNEVLTFGRRGQGLLESLQRHGRAAALAWRVLRRRNFELCLLPRWDIDWYHGTLLAYLSGAPRRAGFSEHVNVTKKHFNLGFDSMLTQQFHDSVIKHDVRHNLDVVGFLGGEVREEHLELWLGAEDEHFAEALLHQHEVHADDLLIALGIGAGAKKRQWPLESYGQLCQWLHNQFHARVVLIGGRGDRSMTGEFRNRLGIAPIDCTGTTTLRQTAALLKRCTLYVGNDAGPMHIAAAAQIPVVELSCHPKLGSERSANSPLRFGPWNTRAVIIQPASERAPCVEECGATVAHCILGISVEQVKVVLSDLLSSAPMGSREQRIRTTVAI